MRPLRPNRPRDSCHISRAASIFSRNSVSKAESGSEGQPGWATRISALPNHVSSMPRAVAAASLPAAGAGPLPSIASAPLTPGTNISSSQAAVSAAATAARFHRSGLPASTIAPTIAQPPNPPRIADRVAFSSSTDSMSASAK